MKIDKYEWDELTAALSPEDLAWLAYGARAVGLRQPETSWTSVPGLVTHAITIATLRLAPEFEGTPAAQLDKAEGSLVRGEIADRRGYDPKNVRRLLASWVRGIRDPSDK